jgi:hypothetical protein
MGVFPPKTCSLCGVLKELEDFGPKKGSRDGKDCYCRICSTLRRRYTIPVRCHLRCSVLAACLMQVAFASKSRLLLRTYRLQN